MANPWDDLADASLTVIKDSLKGLVENNPDVEAFAKEHTQDFAREWWSAKNAGSDADREEHEANLKHLIAQARGRARRLQISLSEEVKDTLGRILETVGNVLLTVGPKLLVALA